MSNVSCVHRFSTIIAYCLCLVGPVLGQTAQSSKVDAPNIKVGDSWTYDRIDGWKKSKEFTTVTVVISVDEKEIRTESKRTDTGAVTKRIHNKDLNPLVTEQRRGKDLSEPYYPRYAFPLEVGKTWEQKVIFTRTYETDRKVVATLKGTVLGWEQVTVPAGTFNALKIEVKGWYNGSNYRGTWSGRMADTIWYVPELKNAAKWIYQDTTGTQTFNHDIWELVEYKPAQ